MSQLSSYIARFALPVRRHPTFFVVLAALLSVGPVWTTVFAGAHIYRFMLATALESIAVAYIISLVLFLAGRNLFTSCLKWVILALATIWAVVECGTIGTTGSPINQAVIGLMLDTDPGEASGFFSRYLGFKAVMALIALPLYLAAAIAAERCLRKLSCLHTAIFSLLVFCVVIGCVLMCRICTFVLIKDYDNMLVWVGQGCDNPELIHYYELNYTVPPVKIAYIAKINNLENKEIEAFDRLQNDIYRNVLVSADSTRRFNVVVIIGESMIRLHSSLYGYRLPTNPVLEAQRDSGRVVVFSDIMTTANYTTTALRNLMSTADTSRGERWTDGAYFPMLLKRAGIEVNIFDNQLTDARSDTGLGRVLYSPLNMSEIYTLAGDSLFDYDGAFATYANRCIRPDSLRQQCVIYHLKGQHFDAANRFDTAPRFSAADITEPEWLTTEQRQDIADYDSATFYNDSVVGALLRPWGAVPTIAFYFSDHGEDIADLGPTGARNKPRPDDPEWVDRQFHIPFMVWMSDPFRLQYPHLAESIATAADRSGSLDQLGVNILNLLGITYQYNQ